MYKGYAEIAPPFLKPQNIGGDINEFVFTFPEGSRS